MTVDRELQIFCLDLFSQSYLIEGKQLDNKQSSIDFYEAFNCFEIVTTESPLTSKYTDTTLMPFSFVGILKSIKLVSISNFGTNSN